MGNPMQAGQDGPPKTIDGTPALRNSESEDLSVGVWAGMQAQTDFANQRKRWYPTTDREPMVQLVPVPPTPEQVKAAGDKLGKDTSSLIPQDVRQSVKDIQRAVLNGDTATMATALRDIQRKHPEMTKDLVSELNREFKDTNAGVAMAVESNGNIVLYKTNPLELSGNSAAVQVNPTDGSVGARSIKIDSDGNVVLQPGELLNANPDAIAKGIGNAAVGGINGGPDSPRLALEPRYDPARGTGEDPINAPSFATPEWEKWQKDHASVLPPEGSEKTAQQLTANLEAGADISADLQRLQNKYPNDFEGIVKKMEAQNKKDREANPSLPELNVSYDTEYGFDGVHIDKIRSISINENPRSGIAGGLFDSLAPKNKHEVFVSAEEQKRRRYAEMTRE